MVGSTVVQGADLSDLDRWITEIPYLLPKDLPPLPPALELQVIDAMGVASNRFILKVDHSSIVGADVTGNDISDVFDVL